MRLLVIAGLLLLSLSLVALCIHNKNQYDCSILFVCAKCHLFCGKWSDRLSGEWRCIHNSDHNIGQCFFIVLVSAIHRRIAYAICVWMCVRAVLSSSLCVDVFKWSGHKFWNSIKYINIYSERRRTTVAKGKLPHVMHWTNVWHMNHSKFMCVPLGRREKWNVDDSRASSIRIFSLMVIEMECWRRCSIGYALMLALCRAQNTTIVFAVVQLNALNVTTNAQTQQQTHQMQSYTHTHTTSKALTLIVLLLLLLLQCGLCALLYLLRWLSLRKAEHMTQIGFKRNGIMQMKFIPIHVVEREWKRS